METLSQEFHEFLKKYIARIAETRPIRRFN